MKINNIVELIYAPYGYGWGEVGDIGILTHPFGAYNWMVDIVDQQLTKFYTLTDGNKNKYKY